jgi:amino acid permease
MFTILNILNYLLGKPVSVYVLILAIIAIYYYTISNCWTSIKENKFYLVTMIISMIIDISSIIIIFTIVHDYVPESNNSSKKIKSLKKSKSAKKKDEKQNKLTNDNLINGEKMSNQEKGYVVNAENAENAANDANNKSIISVYDPDALASLHTY